LTRYLVLLAVTVWGVSAQTSAKVRGAVGRSLPLLERSAATFVAKRACLSCHHNILPILAFHLARERGLDVDSQVLKAVEEKTFRQLRGPGALDTAVQAATLSDPTPNDSMLLMAAHAAGVEPDLVTGVYAWRIAHWQRDGHWVTSDFRPPHSSSVFTASATAVRAIRLYLPDEMRAEGDAVMARARRWFLATRPSSTEDATFRLLGLVWAGGTPDEIARGRKDLWSLQRPGGGWAELPGYSPDAYSTGEALYALHEAGVAATDSAWRKGSGFLLSTQAADGSWHVRTRMVSPAQVSPEYFASGFPYAKDEYLSYAASCWAVMALLEALPATSAPAVDRAQSENAGPWERVALFGTVRQLAALLEAGLDPNTRTSSGTTLLMMAAPDEAKVRLLLDRGADTTARAHSGCDALTIAAAYRGTAGGMRALLDAHAEASTSALVFAAMTGDLANVKLLLAADPETNKTKALTSALTFGYADVTLALLAAGASAQITESTGINLLHWAAITDRPSVIPLLVKAGVPINATDQNGFTPLMYAATIDFGDTAVLDALLHAGADQTIRNGEGRTPLEQARYYGHARLEAVLSEPRP
jgi:ankyrin repeat protein